MIGFPLSAVTSTSASLLGLGTGVCLFSRGGSRSGCGTRCDVPLSLTTGDAGA